MDSRNAEYIQLLQERNRLKKAIRSKSEKEKDLEDRERGFTAHFSGANAPPGKAAAPKTAKEKALVTPIWRQTTGARPTSSSNQGVLLAAASEFQEAADNANSDATNQPKKSKGWAQIPTSLFGMPLGKKEKDRPSGQLQAENQIPSISGVAASSPDSHQQRSALGSSPIDIHSNAAIHAPPTAARRLVEEEEEEEINVRQSYESDIYCEDFEPLSDDEPAVPPISGVRIISSVDGHPTRMSPIDRHQSQRVTEEVMDFDEEDDFEGGGLDVELMRNNDYFGASGHSKLPPTVPQSKTSTPDSKRAQLTSLIDQAVAASPIPTFTSTLRKSNGSTPSDMRSPQSPLMRSPAKKTPTPVIPFVLAEASSSHSHPPTATSMLIVSPKRGDISNVTTESTTALELTVRVKILSTWKKSKTAALSALVMQRCDSSDPDESADCLNLLPNGFDIKIQSGFESLPASHECVKSVTSRLTIAANLHRKNFPVDEKSLWKGPVSSDRPLEICCRGTLDPSSLLSDYQLLLVNGWGPLSCKDVDIYVGTKCIWSGTLSDTSDLIARVSLPVFIMEALRSSLWTQRIPLQQAAPQGNNSNSNLIQQKTPGLSPSLSQARLSTERPSSRSSSHPTVGEPRLSTTLFSSPSTQDAKIDDIPGSSAPLWLPQQSSRPSSRSQSLLFATEDYSQASNREASAQQSHYVPSSQNGNSSVERKQRLSLIARSKSSDSNDNTPSTSQTQTIAGVVVPLVSENVANSLTRRRRNRGDDSKLMASIDAVSMSERSNFGRLSRTGVSDLFGNGDVDNSTFGSNGAATSATATAEHNALASAAAVLAAKRSRQRRIGEVTQTVSKALSDLSQVVSNITVPSNPPTKDMSFGALPLSLLLSPVGDEASTPALLIGASIETVDRSDNSSTGESAHSNEAQRALLAESLSTSLTGTNSLLASTWNTACAITSPLRSSYETPLLPRGSVMIIEIMSNWGDNFYIGLNGIDIFDASGSIISSQSKQAGMIARISAVPSGMDALPESVDDPRVAANLIDGCNFTRDDLHVWLAPILESNPSKPIATITIEFSKPVTLSMLRVFNYNKSRTHVQRGARHCKISLDDAIIFEGEIRASDGELFSASNCSEVILFAVDDKILKNIADYDARAGYYTEDTSEEWLKKLRQQIRSDRPSTGDTEAGNKSDIAFQITDTSNSVTPLAKASVVTAMSQSKGPERVVETPPSKLSAKSEQPSGIHFDRLAQSDATSASVLKAGGTRVIASSSDLEGSFDFNNLMSELSEAMTGGDELFAPSMVQQRQQPHFQHTTLEAANNIHSSVTTSALLTGKTITVHIHSTWGDRQFVGLSGIEVLEGLNAAPISSSSFAAVDAEPHSMAAIGFSDDNRLPKNLINGVNDVTDDQYMWLAPFNQTAGGKHYVKLRLKQDHNLAGLRIWNYNKAGESTLRGAKDISIEIDGTFLFKTICRLAPGSDGVPTAQTFIFHNYLQGNSLSASMPGVSMSATTGRGGQYVRYLTPPLRQDYEVPMNLSGMLWKIVLYDNWGDEYYVGLDMIQMFDGQGNLIDFAACQAQIAAVPHSIRDLSHGAQDARVPNNLLRSALQGASNSNDLQSATLSWLAPLSRSMTAEERNAIVMRTLRQQRPFLDHFASRNFEEYKEIVQSGHADAVNLPEDNVLFLSFQYPITVSVLRIFNYSKTPERGVKEFGIFVDGLLVHMGHLKMHVPEDQQPQSKQMHHVARTPQSIVFTNDPRIVRNEKDNAPYCGSTEQDVLYINDRQVMVRSKDMYNRKPSVAAEGVYVDIAKRPMTSAVK